MAHSYGLNRAERVDDYKSAREFILTLIDLVSRGGNLLLDIGPYADGTIPPLMEERLLEIGDWLRVNGEAIYGTRPASRAAQWTTGTRPKQEYGEFMVKYNLLDQVGQQPRDGMAVKQVFFTQQKDGTLYAISAGWPGRKLVLRGISAPKGEVVLLGHPTPLRTTWKQQTLTVEMPDFGPEEAPCRYAFALRLPGATLRAAE
jgi:alpha-L-fucosidase